MSIFSTIKNTLVRAAIYNGKARSRYELLRMSDRQLTDFGFSRALLLEGVAAWPWRLEEETATVQASAVVGNAVKPSQAKQEVQQAINELRSYSDRELAELGVTRSGIEEAVLYGRPSVEGEFESRKHAA